MMQGTKKIGKQSVKFTDKVYITGRSGVAAGLHESDSRYADYFDIVGLDDTLGEESYEKTERLLYKTAVLSAINHARCKTTQMDLLIGGDLLNQIISSGFTARELEIPFLGIYGACSAMAESLLLGGCWWTRDISTDVCAHAPAILQQRKGSFANRWRWERPEHQPRRLPFARPGQPCCPIWNPLRSF